jgi:hypothetical protein
MKEYMLRLITNHPFVNDWELRFKEHEDKNAIESAIKFLSVIGNNPAIIGAHLFYLQPIGTIKEFVRISIFEVKQNIGVKTIAEPPI